MPEWAPRFLKALKSSPNVSAAAEAAGIDRSTAYDWRSKNEVFRQAWDNALDAALDRLEQKAFERAENTSDTLAIFLLKSHRPERYGEKLKVEHSGEIQVDWGDPQGHDAPPAPGPVVGPDAPSALQGPGLRTEMG